MIIIAMIIERISVARVQSRTLWLIDWSTYVGWVYAQPTTRSSEARSFTASGGPASGRGWVVIRWKLTMIMYYIYIEC